MRLRPLLGVIVFAALATTAACRRNRGPAPTGPVDSSIVARLGSPDPDDREDAAKDLRRDNGPPLAAVPYLIAAVASETENNALENMLLTLGASGAPEARPVLDNHLRHPEEEIREAAEKGLTLWAKRTGQADAGALRDIAKLQSPDWGERREAADDLRDDGGPPREAIGPLLQAGQHEMHPKALGAMLLTLGESGAPEARPFIEANQRATNDDVRKYANKAMKTWRSRNGEMVRQDILTAPPPPPALAGQPAPAAAPQGPDGCEQFKSICGADPFAVEQCQADTKGLSYRQQVVWAECVNTSPDACQRAHQLCMASASASPK